MVAYPVQEIFGNYLTKISSVESAGARFGRNIRGMKAASKETGTCILADFEVLRKLFFEREERSLRIIIP